LRIHALPSDVLSSSKHRMGNSGYEMLFYLLDKTSLKPRSNILKCCCFPQNILVFYSDVSNLMANSVLCLCGSSYIGEFWFTECIFFLLATRNDF
jgi:hypothetical protein